MNTMILLSGVPGCGKSTWTRKYKEKHDNVFVVESDDIRRRLNGNAQIFSKEKDVWSIFLKELQNLSEKDGVTAIADSTNLQNVYRINYVKNTPKFTKHVLVHFNVPFEVAEANNKTRHGDKVVPDGAMKSLEAELEPLSQEVIDLYDEIIEVNQNFEESRIK